MPFPVQKTLKTVPGLVVSLFFLWFTFHKTSFRALMAVKIVDHRWLLIALLSLACGYTLRAHRWWRMLSASGPVSFAKCALVLLTSFGANNIFPLRLGDVMRVFFYSKDLKARSSAILSSVILERILDVFALLVLLLVAIHGSANFPWPRAKLWGSVMLTLATIGILLLMIFADIFHRQLETLLSRFEDKGFAGKLSRSVTGGLDAFRKIGLPVMLGLMLESVVIWLFEGMVFVSAAKALDLAVEWIAPWQALVLSNLATLLPSTPGYIGTFDYAAKVALTSSGLSQSVASFYALLVHALVWMPITVAGGVSFLLLRYSRREAEHVEMEAQPNNQTLEEMPIR